MTTGSPHDIALHRPDADVPLEARQEASTAWSDCRWENELVRKGIHLGMVVLPVWIATAPAAWRSRGLVLALLLLLSADVLRRVWNPWARWIEGWSRPYRRPQERHLWVGVHAMVLSAWVLSWSVAPRIAVLSLCFGVFGDAAAALVGMRRRGTAGKSLLGSLACFVACVGVGVLLLPQHPGALLAGAVTATLCERFSGPIEDNLTIPLGAAIVLSLLT